MYNSSNVAERIKSRAKDMNITVKQTLEKSGLGFNTMSNMKTSMPKGDSLGKIADVLDCSVDYLLGRTDNPQSHKAGNTVSVGVVSGNNGAIGVGNMVTNNAPLLDEHQKLLLELYNKLSPIEQIELIASLNSKKQKSQKRGG